MRCQKLLVLLTTFWFSTLAVAFDQQHANWAETLKTYRNDQGMVAYAKLKDDASKDPKLPFNSYLSELQTVTDGDFQGWDQNHKKAFLINAYNAFTVKLILDHYPVDSIKKIGGFMAKPWGVKFFKLLDGQIRTLDPIEHDYLRPLFKDLRIHAALNCASKSCPILRGEPYLAEKLDIQLDEQMQLWLKDATRNEFEESSGKLRISRIFDWYEKDFDRWGGGVREVIRRYGPPSAIKALEKKGKISHLPYDWSLNQSL